MGKAKIQKKMNFSKFEIGKMTNREIFVKIFHIFLGLTISNIIFSAINVIELEWEYDSDWYNGYYNNENGTKETITRMRQNTYGEGFIALAATIPINVFLLLIKLYGFSKCRDVTFIVFTVLSWEALITTIIFQSDSIEMDGWYDDHIDKHALHDFCLWADLFATVGLLIMSFIIFGMLCKQLCCHKEIDESSISLISNVEVITHDEENPDISIRKENGKKIVTVNTTKSKAENSIFYSEQSESVSKNQKSSIVKSGHLYRPLEEY